MITIATLFWQANQHSKHFSAMYDESWVEKLYAGFRRNLSIDFRFVCFTDRLRRYSTPVIEQELIRAKVPNYSTCIEPYRLGVPMILVGLDTIVTGNIDHLAAWCMKERDEIALPRDPYFPNQACNGVALVPAGKSRIYTEHRGEDDMEWVRRWGHVYIDTVFPGQVKSFKGHVKQLGLGDVRICYFHGMEKPHQLQGVEWIAKHWRS